MQAASWKHCNIGLSRQLSGVFLVIFSAACYGAMPVFVRLVYASGSEPFTLLFLRFDSATLVMLAILLIRRQAFPTVRLLAALFLIGALCYVGQSLSYYVALSLASAGLVALLFFLYPALVTVFSALLFKERITGIKAGALVLALLGGVLTANPSGGSQPLGILLGLASAIIYAAYILASSRVMDKVKPIPATAVIVTAAGLVYTLIILVRGAHFPQTPSGWLGVGFISLVSTVMAIITFLAGLERIGASSTSMLSTVEPVTAIFLSALVLQEAVLPVQLLGGMLILAAVILLAMGEKKSGEARKLPTLPG